jgi:hypothetical protein
MVLKRIEYKKAGTAVIVYFDRYQSFVQPLFSCNQQPCILNKVQYPDDRDILKVTWFHKMTTQVSKS